MPGLGHGQVWAYLVANPLPAAVRLNAAEYVKAALEPIGEAVGYFQRFVHGVLGGIDAVLHRSAS